jgi:phage tail-like protein
MAQSPVHPQRLGLYANFRCHVLFGADVVAGMTTVGGLTRSKEVSKQHLEPGQTDFAPITLEGGVSDDPAFVQWACAMVGAPFARNTSSLDFRKTITLDIHDEAGQKVLAVTVYNAWVSEFDAVPDLDGLGNTLLIERMTLQHEGWAEAMP